MTQFQLVAVGVFVAALVLANGKTILSVLGNVAGALRRLSLPRFAAGPAAPEVLGPRERVRDLVTVSELRDRLAAVGCSTGVEACTLLLRSIVDHPADCTK